MLRACMPVRMRSSGSGWYGFGSEDRCDDYGAVPDSPERRWVGGFACRRGLGRPRCGVAGVSSDGSSGRSITRKLLVGDRGSPCHLRVATGTRQAVVRRFRSVSAPLLCTAVPVGDAIPRAHDENNSVKPVGDASKLTRVELTRREGVNIRLNQSLSARAELRVRMSRFGHYSPYSGGREPDRAAACTSGR